MPIDTQQIMEAAEKLGAMVAQHPAVAKFQKAQLAVAEDPEASRLMGQYEHQLEALARQQESGMPLADAQRQQLESLQSQIVSHIKVKALNLAQVDFIDLLRKITQTIQRPLQGSAAAPTGPRLASGQERN